MRYWLFRWFPQNAFSRALGRAAGRAWPPWLLRPVIALYVRAFGIDMADFERPPGGFATFNEFFARPLKPGLRPVDPDPARIASPVDGAVLASGHISEGRLLQVKGRDFAVEELLAGDPAWRGFEGGQFITLYLSPRDYHRIHAPCRGRVTRFTYVPGELWSVSPAFARAVPRLFARNERLVTWLDTEFGTVAVVAVGAMVVGKIKVVYHSIVSNSKGRMPLSERLEAPFPMEKGAELGRFELGSTVILLLPPGDIVVQTLAPGEHVKMGQTIAAPG